MVNLYKWLWSKIGGRPWTYIWRDIYHEAEWLIQAIWFWSGIAAYYFTQDLLLISILWLVYTYGYINGHFFWGTPWIKRQKDK